VESPKYSRSDAFVVRPDDKGTIYEYPAQSHALRISFMEVAGRRPGSEGKAFLEEDCTFAIYVVRGSGRIVIEDDSYDIAQDDVVTVLAGRRWYIEGTLAYVTASTPAFYPEQSSMVDI
jgi:mannose-6-phosphate isomerase-like protein (cupin superfamily)